MDCQHAQIHWRSLQRIIESSARLELTKTCISNCKSSAVQLLNSIGIRNSLPWFQLLEDEIEKMNNDLIIIRMIIWLFNYYSNRFCFHILFLLNNLYYYIHKDIFQIVSWKISYKWHYVMLYYVILFYIISYIILYYINHVIFFLELYVKYRKYNI